MSGKEYTAKSIEEALEKALNEMMLTREDIEYEVVQQPSKGFLGIGKKDAVVRVKRKVIEQLKDIVDTIVEEQPAPKAKKETTVQPAKVQPAKIEKTEEIEAIEKPAPAEKPVQEKPVAVAVEQKAAAQPDAEKAAPTVEQDAEPALAEVADERKTISKKEAMANAEEKGKAFLSKIFEEMKMNVTIDVQEKNGYLVFDLKGKNLGILIGRRGDTLDSLQFLLNLVINEKNSAKVKGIIDIEHYRAKREETLIGLSHKLAAKARKTGQKVVLEPMNPQERRIIHMALQNDRRVSTYSEGEEPYRKVVIVPEAKEYHRRKRDNQEQA